MGMFHCAARRGSTGHASFMQRLIRRAADGAYVSRRIQPAVAHAWGQPAPRLQSRGLAASRRRGVGIPRAAARPRARTQAARVQAGA